jgi:hypothetical protein
MPSSSFQKDKQTVTRILHPRRVITTMVKGEVVICFGKEETPNFVIIGKQSALF